MSTGCKTIFERGRFFIETGTARSFNIFCAGMGGIIKYIPKLILRRIEGLIKDNNRDGAVALWAHACKIADKAPVLLVKNILHIGLHIVEAVAIIVFFYAILRLF